MNIEEVKRLRLKLSTDVAELIIAFQRETQCTVTSFDITHFFTDAESQPITTKVEAKIELPW